MAVRYGLCAETRRYRGTGKILPQQRGEAEHRSVRVAVRLHVGGDDDRIDSATFSRIVR
jgi:hypothetical protein